MASLPRPMDTTISWPFTRSESTAYSSNLSPRRQTTAMDQIQTRSSSDPFIALDPLNHMSNPILSFDGTSTPPDPTLFLKRLENAPKLIPGGHFPGHMIFRNQTEPNLKCGDVHLIIYDANNQPVPEPSFLVKVGPTGWHDFYWNRWLQIFSAVDDKADLLAEIKWKAHERLLTTETTSIETDIRPILPPSGKERKAMERTYKYNKKQRKIQIRATKGQEKKDLKKKYKDDKRNRTGDLSRPWTWNPLSGLRIDLRPDLQQGSFAFSLDVDSGEEEDFRWEVTFQDMANLGMGAKKILMRLKTNEAVGALQVSHKQDIVDKGLARMVWVGKSWKSLGRDFEVMAVLSAVVLLKVPIILNRMPPYSWTTIQYRYGSGYSGGSYKTTTTT